MTDEYKLITEFQNEITTTPTALLTTLIGNKGSGKNTFVALAVQEARQVNANEVILANTKITGAIYIPDILKWLAMKLIRKDETYCEVHVDEAAIAGLESRGSFKEARALDSYLFTLSRKVNANITLSSQLMSMIEKRSQWISDFYILCESNFDVGNPLPAYFSFTIYDENKIEVNQLEIDGQDARELLYMRFRTQEIPFQERLQKDFIRYYDISEDDLATYDEVMGIKREPEEEKEETKQITWESIRAFKVGESIILDETRHYLIKARDLIADTENLNKPVFRYYLSEIA